MHRFLTAIVLLLVPILGTAQVVAPQVSADAGGVPNVHSIRVCSVTSHALPACAADVRVDAAGIPQTGTAPPAGSFGPAQFHTGYALPCAVGGTGVHILCAKPATFGGQTIAIVDAYIDPNIEADLGVYDTQYGLPACTQSNGCLKIVNMCKSSGHKFPAQCFSDQGWELEASMDVEVAHAICQTCKILFVEASYADLTNLGNAENMAVQDGATEISNSWAGSETAGESQYDASWNHAGVATFFASGDANYGAMYPSVAPSVIAVGGTTLTLNPDNTYAGETVWSNPTSGQGTGSGCSLYEKANPWQTSLPNWNATGCGALRASTDISADADPATGAAVYDSFGYFSSSGWYEVGGTSLATPLAASITALAGGAAQYQNPSQMPYVKMNASNSHNVTTGSNGSCGTIMCVAGTGYNGPTGLGTPSGPSGL